MKWNFAGATHRGQIRTHNEDAYSVRHGALGAFIVADGLGGHEGGEVASRVAVEHLESEFERLLNGPELSADLATSQIEAYLTAAMREANTAVRTAAEQDPRLSNMGCTLLTAFICRDQATIAHVGDVRAYRWHSGNLTQVTTDHTEVASLVAKGLLSFQEARHYPFRHRVERAVGAHPHLEVEVRSVELGPGDRLLLCSDGLWNMLDEIRLSLILSEDKESESCVKHLVQEANAAGGEDNITAIVVDLLEGDKNC